MIRHRPPGHPAPRPGDLATSASTGSGLRQRSGTNARKRMRRRGVAVDGTGRGDPSIIQGVF